MEDENDVISDQLTACCQEPADLLICKPASLDISSLGSGPLLLPNGIALSFLQRLGSTSNHPAFSYAAHNNDDEENGAELTIVCNPATRACHGQATTTSQAGESFVLEPCGGGGGGGSAAAPMQHVWKQINSRGGSNNNNNRPLNQDEQEREETEDEEEEEDELERGDKQAQVNDEGEEREEEEQEQEGLVEGEEEKKDNEEVEEEMVGGEEGEDSAEAITYSIRFYYTPDFANETKDVAAFVDKVVAETNHGYETVADLKVRAAAHCAPSPAPATIKEELLDPSLQMKRFTTGVKANVEELRNTADLAVLLVNEFQLGICGVAYHNGLAGGQLLAIVRKSCIEPALKPVPKEERHFSNLARLVDLLLNPPTEGEAAVAKNADGLATISVNPYERPATNGTEVAGRRQLFTKLAAVGDESAGCSDEDEQQVSSSYEQYEEEEEKDE